jgi:hypothetical protein
MQQDNETRRGGMKSPGHSQGKTTTQAAPSRIKTETPSQAKKIREQDGQSTSRKHSTDQPHLPHQISHHQLSSSTSTIPMLPARQRSPRPSSPSSQARQQALMEYHLKH